MRTPQPTARYTILANKYMKYKGYDNEPVHYIKIEDSAVYYLYYDIPEGLLELEVDVDSESVRVTSFEIGTHADVLMAS